MTDVDLTKLVEGIQKLRIETVRLTQPPDPELQVVFGDGSVLAFRDDAQSCCERRYMTCDDDLLSFTGDRIARFYVADVSLPSKDDEYEVHDIQFLHIRLASGAAITCQTHNEHNGFYGGFSVHATYRPSDGADAAVLRVGEEAR